MQLNEDMQKALRQHIVQDLDACMEAGCIKVYYQPVMRTLTGEICGMEALARWDDPEYGLLPPIAFIPVLEEAHLIHKLDMCIIQQICEEYAIREKRHEELATVSFNLSRMDFQYCDIHSFIDETIRANRLPRDIFRVEITESIMEDDEKRMHDVIDRFWDSGLRVWMDDFGSGYSSLNVLKDYHFDTIKIDMVFMRDFDVRSREIITSVVDMSKRIGVHTLAEGVETEEQLAFLRSIGCEKAQGYYIGKPMPYEACIAHLAKNDLKIEAREKKQYYHDIGTINLMSPTPMFFQEGDEVDGEEALAGQIPLAILEVTDDGHIHYLFANDSYIRMLNSVGIEGTEEIEAAYEKTNTPFAQRFGQMIQRARQTGETETVNFVHSGRHCFAQMRRVAGYPGGAAYLCIFQNLSLGVEAGKEDTLTTFANDLFYLYDEIELIDLNSGFSRNIYRTTQNLDTYNKRPAREELWDFAERQVYPEDREKFKEFMDPYTVEKRLDESIAPFISRPFRIMGADGIYAWKLQLYLYAGDKKDRRVLACTRRIDRNNLQLLKKAGDLRWETEENAEAGQERKSVITPDLLWRNVDLYSDQPYFWKDRDRRFVGANRRFLEYYGLSSVDEIIGKNDEEMGWHVNPLPFKSDEERVLETGERTQEVPGTCICNGEIRNIIASKMPIYDDGQIVGLMGTFRDVTDQLKAQEQKEKVVTTVDEQTGMLNFLGIIDAALHYQESYVTQGTDFAVIFLNIERFRYYNEKYGIKWGNALLTVVGQVLRFTVGVTGVTGRYSGDHFMVLTQCQSEADLRRMIDRIEQRVSKIEVIEGVPCTVYFKKGYARYSETNSLKDLYSLAEERSTG